MKHLHFCSWFFTIYLVLWYFHRNSCIGSSVIELPERISSKNGHYENFKIKQHGNQTNNQLEEKLADERAISCYVTSNRVEDIFSCTPLFNDPMYMDQWFMLPWTSVVIESSPIDMNILPVWIRYKIFGRGIVVVVIDTGVEVGHDDLRDNYDHRYGYNAIDGNRDVSPKGEIRQVKSHGTMCAGVIAMKANNNKCGVGIAPLVTLGAVSALNDEQPKQGQEPEPAASLFTKAILFKHKEIDITSNSYSTVRFLTGFSKLRPIYKSAVKQSILKGRRGKGVIHVFSSGNEKWIKDAMCGGDAFHNTMYTIKVATIAVDGGTTHYCQRCPAVMVTVYANKYSKDKQFKIPTTTLNNRCTKHFGYSSAGAAITTGVIALVLNANSDLGWRDVQHLIASTTRSSAAMMYFGDWQRNTAGFYVSPDFGFGLLDAYKIVSAARKFTSVPPMATCVTVVDTTVDLQNLLGIKKKNSSIFGYLKKFTGAFDDMFSYKEPSESVETKYISFGRRHWLKKEIKIDGCDGTSQEINYIEHLQLQVSLTYPKLGDVQLKITSPGGTKAKLLDFQPKEMGTFGLDKWTFDSVMTWGESPEGTWTIDVFDLTGDAANYGEILEMALIIHGTKERPKHYDTGSEYRASKTYEAKDFFNIMSDSKTT